MCKHSVLTGRLYSAGIAVAGQLVDDATIPNLNTTFSNRFGVGAYAGFALAKLGIYTFDEVRPTSVVWDPSVSTTDSPAAILVPAIALLFAALLAMLI